MSENENLNPELEGENEDSSLSEQTGLNIPT
jgi:hypothetical protein